jgi:two-component system cell cycle sensor histidine kinase/response regulator CckA
MPAALAQGNQESDRQTIEAGQVVIEERGDEERVIETRKAAVVDDSGRAAGVVGIIRDITDRKRLEEQAIQEQKEESILTLASGIAHDFNNALVGIVGNIDLLRMDLPIDPEVEKTLTSMEQAAQKMASLTQQLLTYAGQVRYQPQPLNLNLMLEETLAMLQGKCPPQVQVKRTLNEALWEIEISPAEIRQLLVNLITNACESMAKGGGTLAIRTDNVRREAWICSRHRQHAAGEYVHLAVSDTGHGMEPEVQRRLFDPFFSTRFMGRGLGLAVAMAIARDRGGCLEVESRPGAGTLVQVYLPRAQL